MAVIPDTCPESALRWAKRIEAVDQGWTSAALDDDGPRAILVVIFLPVQSVL